jgi:hypothetical protein
VRRTINTSAPVRGGGHHATEAGLPGYHAHVKKQTPQSIPLFVRALLLHFVVVRRLPVEYRTVPVCSFTCKSQVALGL